MRTLLSILLLLLVTAGVSAQQTIVLQPGPEEGKDAMVWDDPVYNKAVRNYGDDPQLLIHSWTDGTAKVYGRAYIQFDFSGCPDMSRLLEAKLYLYNNPEGYYDGQHQARRVGCLLNVNTSEIRCVKEPWDEHTITWENHPAGKWTNHTMIPSQPPISNRDVVVDVTSTVREMYATDPPQNYGFMIRLKAEQPYAALVFTSSDYHIPARRPKLELTFMNATSVDDALPAEHVAMDVSPNPATAQTHVHVRGRTGGVMHLELFNALGRRVFEREAQAGSVQNVPLSALPSGMYFFRLSTRGDHVIRPLVVR